MILAPSFSYYGSKHRLVPMYPEPRHDTIIEPFAGSAAYSHHFPSKKVFLFDANPKVVGVWEYLIRSKEEDIRALPLKVVDLEDMSELCQEAKWFIGFWLNKGNASPCRRPSKWMETDAKTGRMSRGYWGKVIRGRVASQVRYIKHWKIFLKSWENIPSQQATWFVDPPYQGKRGESYPFHDIDYPRLGLWCQSRPGQVIACEGVEGDWLPFRPFVKAQNTSGRHKKDRMSDERVWTKSDRKADGTFGLY